MAKFKSKRGGRRSSNNNKKNQKQCEEDNNNLIDDGEGPAAAFGRQAISFFSVMVSVAIAVCYAVLVQQDNEHDGSGSGSKLFTASKLFLNTDAGIVEDAMSQCTLVMAHSTMKAKGSTGTGWGVFPLTTIGADEPATYGGPVVQVVDVAVRHADSLNDLLHHYTTKGAVTGGIHEGRAVVYSLIAGIGALANGHTTAWNLAPQAGAAVSEAGAVRGQSPGAGAFTHYHDFSYFSYGRMIQPGQEFLTHLSRSWVDKVQPIVNINDTVVPVDELRKNGMCLDHIRPGQVQSKMVSEHAGRGAFATRHLPEGTSVAPVPLLPLWNGREALSYHGRDRLKRTQLLLNYCYGHPESSLLLLPYGPVVNLINHGGKDRSNVKLQWVKPEVGVVAPADVEEVDGDETADSGSSPLHHGHRLLHQTLPQMFAGTSNVPSNDNSQHKNPTGLLLELVATRNIMEGEEILMDYGDAWEQAWEEHMKRFQSDEEDEKYPSHSHHGYAHYWNEETEFLSTEEELLDASSSSALPRNLRTTCFYHFHLDVYEKAVLEKESLMDDLVLKWSDVATNRDYQNLYPCRIVEREDNQKNGNVPNRYTVILQNQESLTLETTERIPENLTVMEVPRQAILISDHIQSTDQHLPDAFRHEIHIPNNVFPEIWKDWKQLQQPL